jgi:hypothetical protein
MDKMDRPDMDLENRELNAGTWLFENQWSRDSTVTGSEHNYVRHLR